MKRNFSAITAMRECNKFKEKQHRAVLAAEEANKPHVDGATKPWCIRKAK